MASEFAAEDRARLERLALKLAIDADALAQFGPRGADEIPQLRAAVTELRRQVRLFSAQLGEADGAVQFARKVIAGVDLTCDEVASSRIAERSARGRGRTAGDHYAAAMHHWRQARRHDALRAEVEAADGGRAWRLVGSYLESCNCEVVCPCRRAAGRPVGRPTYGVCEGALSWAINRGYAGDVSVSGLAVVLAFRYDTAERGSPWDFTLYLDDRANDRQQAVLEALFTGRLGGPPVSQFPWAFKASVQLATRVVPITIDHLARRGWFRAGGYVNVTVAEPVCTSGAVSSLITGNDRDGIERYGDHLRVADGPLAFEHRWRCGYQATFDYNFAEPRCSCT